MARLVVLEYRPRILVGVLALLIGLAFEAMVFLGALARVDAPLLVQAAFALMGLVGLGAGVWIFVYGPRLASVLRRFAGLVRLEGDRLFLRGPVMIRPGFLVARHRVGRGKRSPYTYMGFEESGGEPRMVEALGPGDFEGEAGGVAGFSWMTMGLSVPAGGGKAVVGDVETVEWLRLPAFSVESPEYRVPLQSIVIALLPPVRHVVEISRESLYVSSNNDLGLAEIKAVEGGIEGTLTFHRSPEGGARAVRLELEVERPGIRYKTVLARLEETGSTVFRWTPSPEEPVYLVAATASTLSPSTLLKKMGVEKPVFMGSAWKVVSKAKLRLVLDVPRAKDVVDEADIVVRPA